MAILDRLPIRPCLPVAVFLWCGLIAALTGLSIMAFGRTGAAPAAASLMPVVGRIAAVSVHDLSGKETDGEFFPGLTEVHIRLAEDPDVYVYPAGFPLYFVVRDQVGGAATLWVERDDYDGERTIWALEASGRGGARVTVSHGDIVATLERVDRSAGRTGGGFALVGFGLFGVAWLAGAWNARLPAPSARARGRWLERRDRAAAVMLDVATVFEVLFTRGALAFKMVLGPAIGSALWSLIWCLVYIGATFAVGVAIYGG